MRTLLLLRHAKSSHKDTRLDDHERPLTKRGRRDASRMGSLLVDEEMLPDLIVSSTACRARETTQRFMAAAGFRGPVRFVDELYMASPKEQLRVIRAVPAARRTLMLVGHNPGLEELLWSLTRCDDDLPTASLAQIALPITHWRALTLKTKCKVQRIWRPKELE